MSNITINSTGEISDITIVDSPNRHILQISEHLRNIRREHHSKYMVNERKNDTKIQKYVDTPKYATPVTEKKQTIHDVIWRQPNGLAKRFRLDSRRLHIKRYKLDTAFATISE